MALDILGYIAGPLTKYAKYAKDAANKIVEGAKNKITEGFGKSEPMPETVQKSLGKIHPVTGKDISGKSGDHYGSAYKGDKAEDYERAYSVLFLPLVISGAILAWLIISSKSVQTAAQLSPKRNILFIILLVFTILYALFLILAFIGKKQEKSKK